MGSVRGKRVMLQSSSHVEGDIFHQALAIEQGAFFEGKSRRSDDPTGESQKAEFPSLSGSSLG
jgi:cytoskeletal protein CcmA (bactofilin family)